jgi:gluconolactonase
MHYKVMGEGFLFPEGPIAFPDGSVVFVEILRGTLTRVWGDGKSEVIAEVGGGPNGAALGPDGAVYITNNGGFESSRGADGRLVIVGTTPADYEGGRIERVDLATGKFERILTHCEGRQLRGPNDIVFDRQGGFWFTDLGKRTTQGADYAALYYVSPERKAVTLIHDRQLSYNGVGLSPDEQAVYVADTASARLWAYDLDGPGKVKPPAHRSNPARLIRALNEDVRLDSLAVTEAGNICVGTLGNGGITTFTPQGETSFVAFPDPYVTNICFGGKDRRTAFLTLSSSGRVLSAPWPEPGLALNFCPY